MKKNQIEMYMEIAEVVARLSKAKRMKVGAVAVKDDRIISIGYNGTPAGWDNRCEDEMNGELVTKPEVLHAEENVIAKLARSTESGDGAWMFMTHAPCYGCAKLIYQAGIKKVYYKYPYRDMRAVDFLNKLKVKVIQHGDIT